MGNAIANLSVRSIAPSVDLVTSVMKIIQIIILEFLKGQITIVYRLGGQSMA